MKNFQYQIIRFLPDRVSGEFINLGVVVYSPESKQLSVETVEDTSRIMQVFPRTNTNYVFKLIKHLQESLSDISKSLLSKSIPDVYSDILSITKKALPIDDSSLFFTASEQILDVDIKSCTSYLFDRLVGVNLFKGQESNLGIQFTNLKRPDNIYKKSNLNSPNNKSTIYIFGHQTVSDGDGYAAVPIKSQSIYQPYESFSKQEKV